MRSTTRAMQIETGDMTASTSAPRLSSTEEALGGSSAAGSGAGEAAAGSMRRRGEIDGGNFSLAPRRETDRSRSLGVFDLVHALVQNRANFPVEV